VFNTSNIYTIAFGFVFVLIGIFFITYAIKDEIDSDKNAIDNMKYMLRQTELGKKYGYK
jgi:cell division protein FtsX